MTATFSLTDRLPTGRVSIEASAGTGKTYTLAGLVARFVAESAVPIDEILLVTFTRAAAAELRDRVRARLIEAATALRSSAVPADDALLALMASADRAGRAERLEQAVADFDAATITTIHGFAQKVLGTLGCAAPGDLEATLVDDTNELVSAACADALVAESVADPQSAGQLPTLKDLHGAVKRILNNPGIELIPGPLDHDSTPGAARLRRLIDRVLTEVDRRRRAGGTMSFDDVLTQLRDALHGSPGTVAALRRRYRVALIDEFQDTDTVQWDLFSTLFGRPEDGTTLILVADPKQAIYAFRGANVHTYLKAATERGTTQTTLGTNWRSDGAVLRANAQLLTGATFGDARIGFFPVEAAPGHLDRRLRTLTGDPLPGLCVRAALGADIKRTTRGEIGVPDAEAAIAGDLAEEVHRLLESARLPQGRAGTPTRRVRPKDIAVLIRTHAEAASIHSELQRRGIPVVVARGGSVLQSAAAAHWRWLLTALTRPADPTRARSAALSWFFGWPPSKIDEADDSQLSEVQEQLFRWVETLDSHGTIDFCAQLWSESGISARVLGLPGGDRHLTDLDHIAALLQSKGSGHRLTAIGMLSFLDELEREVEIDPDNDVTARHVESEAEAVQIMTIYAAKGLEFPVVCVPTLWRRWAHVGAAVVFEDPVSGSRTFDVANKEDWPTKKEAAERKELASQELVGENLRLLYVALTRAMHQTLVWWSRSAGSDVTGLARVLFGRDAGLIDHDLFAAPKMDLPQDDDVEALLGLAFGPAGDTVAVSVTGAADGAIIRWEDDGAPQPSGQLELALLERELDRRKRRWSFSAISDRAHANDLDPEDESLGDAGATDEPTDEPDRVIDDAPQASDLILGPIPGGAQFGTLVHKVLEHIDFAAPDLPSALRVQVHDQLHWNPWPVDETVLISGLRSAIETPLGPLFAGQSLCDFTRHDYLSELNFELRLGEHSELATDAEIGQLVLRHLPADDPLRPWAQSLASGLFHVELAGHLTGSIDLIVRVTDPAKPTAEPRFVVVDYKTNKLSAFGRESQSADYDQTHLPAAMAEHHYPLQALLYAVAVHRYLRWRLPNYDPATHLGGAAYLFVRGMVGPDTPAVEGRPNGVFGWPIPPELVTEMSDLLDGRLGPT
jgi:exodeoxyribonuclease V beta subunit